MKLGRLTQWLGAMLVSALLTSCGGGSIKLKAKSNSKRATSFRAENITFGDSSANGSATPAPGEETDNTRFNISNGTISFSTSVGVLSDPFGRSTGYVPKIRVSIYGPKGELVESRIREGSKIDWEFKLVAGDGDYEIRGELGAVQGDIFKPSKRWSRFVRLDTSAPEIRAAATMTSPTNGAGRTLVIRAAIGDLNETSCTAQIEPGVQVPADTIAVGLATDTSPAPTATPEAGPALPLRRLVSSSVSVPDTYPNMILVRVNCVDAFNHASEIVDASAFDQPQFNLEATLDAPKGIPFENREEDGATQIYILRTGTAPGGIATRVRLVGKLIDRTSLTPVSDVVVAREKPRLQLYLSDFEIRDIHETETVPTGKTIFLRKLFDSAVEGSISSSLLGAKTIYATLTQLRESDGSEALLSSRPIPIYVEPNGAGWAYSWLSGNQFVPAAQDAEISLRVQMAPRDGTGSPLASNPSVEYTADNATWTPIDSSDWAPVVGEANTYTFKIRYPHATEQAFRIRLKGVSLAGNQTVSDYSRNLVAPSGFAVGGSTCSGSGVRAKLGSSFLCRREVSGNTRYFFMTVLESMGTSPISITADPSHLCGSDYCFSANLTTSLYNEVSKVAGDSLMVPGFVNHATSLFYLGNFSSSDFGSMTSVNASFGLNGPTCSASNPSFVVKSSSLAASLSVFNCE